jgi:hypothetical protein
LATRNFESDVLVELTTEDRAGANLPAGETIAADKKQL